MPVMKLTKAAVDAAVRRHKGLRVDYQDTEINGFMVRVTENGATYVYRYRKGGRGSSRPSVTIGRYGEITPDEARKVARAHAAAIARGDDPAGAVAERKAALSVADLMERYLVDHAEVKKKPKSALYDRQMIDRVIRPKLGKKLITDVTHADIDRLHNSRRTTPYDANRMLALLSKAFGLAERWGMRPRGSNPCADVQKYKEHKRERVLSGDEIAKLAHALDAAASGSITDLKGKAHMVSPYAVWAIRLLFFTGARKSEILTLRWEHVSFERAALELPDSKTGAKVILLNEPALEILGQIPRLPPAPGCPGNPYVILGDKPGKHLINLAKPWKYILENAGLSDVRIHDLRHNFGIYGASNGLSIHMIGKLLGHTQISTTMGYARFQNDPVREAAEQMGQHLKAAMRMPPASNVIPIKGR